MSYNAHVKGTGKAHKGNWSFSPSGIPAFSIVSCANKESNSNNSTDEGESLIIWLVAFSSIEELGDICA